MTNHDTNLIDLPVTVTEENNPIESTALISTHYLKQLFLFITCWAILFIGFIWIINPYGVSPIQINIRHINTEKPKRIDIDRLIKPYEVWRYQPKTIFLGTSRIHQSMDPSNLDKTNFAPAYNAAIPASTLSQNAASLEQYFQLDKNLHVVFVELFIYNFIFPQPEAPKKTWANFFETNASLLISSDAFIDSLQTLRFNHEKTLIGPYIGPRGNWIRPKNFNTQDTFNAKLFIDNIIKIHSAIPDMIIQPTAVQSLDKIVALCQQHHAELYFVLTPNYPWDDYRLLSLGYWPLLEEWMKKISTYKNVYSFSQYNDLLTEHAGKNMNWWNDPLHFSSNMGSVMLKSLLGTAPATTPKNLILPITHNTVNKAIKMRRVGLNNWMKKNRQFTIAFDHAKLGKQVERGHH